MLGETLQTLIVNEKNTSIITMKFILKKLQFKYFLDSKKISSGLNSRAFL